MGKTTVEADLEDMLGTLDEYTRKLVEAIQQEKERATEEALPESGSIVVPAGQGRGRHLLQSLFFSRR
jgi:hypothetical protein